MDIVYKLVEDEEEPRIKLAPGKLTLPGRKQVHRVASADGSYGHDVVAVGGRRGARRAEPLLEQVMFDGRRTGSQPSLEDLRAFCRAEIDRLPERLRPVERAPPGGHTPCACRRVSKGS